MPQQDFPNTAVRLSTDMRKSVNFLLALLIYVPLQSFCTVYNLWPCDSVNLLAFSGRVGLADFWHYERSVLPALKLSATLAPEGWNPTVPADFYDKK